MSFRSFSRIRVLAMSLAAVTATTTLFAIAGAAGPAAAATSKACPASKAVASLPTASNVAASFANSGNTTTYTFSSLTAEPVLSLGVPGLMKYCVYTTTQPQTITTSAKGANGDAWVTARGTNNFGFVRPGGDKTNIPLDGNTTAMGAADWGTATPPATQTIILHINDPTVCTSLFPGSTSATCFVKPSTGPRCTTGDTNVAYNAMPFDVVNCLNPAIGFEATSTSEFGNGVTLASGTGRNLSQLKVDFQSFACQSGHWNTGDCSSAPGSTFNWPITANIYDPNGSGGLTTPIATVTTTQTIPYRPSASGATTCPSDGGTTPPQWTAGSQWFNPQAVGGGACQNSIGTVLTFNFPSGTVLPGTVVWTVAFNTSDFGAKPQRPQACNTGPDTNFPGLADGGCPYDSLNVGDNGNTGGLNNPASHINNAPYAGTDTTPASAYLSSTWIGAYCDNGAAGTGFLRLDQGCWDGLRPLGEIITN